MFHCQDVYIYRAFIIHILQNLLQSGREILEVLKNSKNLIICNNLQ